VLLATGGECKDAMAKCTTLAQKGICNKTFMKKYCKLSCKACRAGARGYEKGVVAAMKNIRIIKNIKNIKDASL